MNDKTENRDIFCDVMDKVVTSLLIVIGILCVTISIQTIAMIIML